MLDKQDLQAIKELIDTTITASITASEERMKFYVDRSIDSAIRASENRTHAYIEGAIIPQLQLLAEGHQNILDTLAPKNRAAHSIPGSHHHFKRTGEYFSVVVPSGFQMIMCPHFVQQTARAKIPSQAT